MTAPAIPSAMPTRTGSTRTLDFFPNGAVKSITDGGSNASFAYDAFGALQQLTVYTTNADRRADKNFGVFVKQRIEGSQSVINRRIPIPGGGATLHGAMTGKWTFAFGEARGTRFVTDKAGNFVQDIDYQPFGEVEEPDRRDAGHDQLRKRAVERRRSPGRARRRQSRRPRLRSRDRPFPQPRSDSPGR